MLNSDILSQLKQFKQDLRVAHNRFEGTVRSTPGRFGFCLLDDGRDVFLSPEQMLRVLAGDRILVEVSEDDKGRLSGIPLELLSSEVKFLVGTAVCKGQAWFINADFGNSQRWLFIPPKNRKQLQEGLYIVGKLAQHPFKDSKAQVEIVNILGKADKPGIQTDYVMNKYHIQPKVRHALETPRLQAVLAAEIARRPSLTSIPFVTIDADTTRDIDDALYCETTADGWKLQVGIADPSAFFDVSDPLDAQARLKAQTLYFPDRIVSMLPENLSLDMASLVEGKDRLALVCEMQIDRQGAICSYSLSEATLRVKHRLSYASASAMLDSEAGSSADSAVLSSLRACSDALHEWRKTAALISADRPDYSYQLDDKGQISQIMRVEPTLAHQIVEEAMIAANRCAAKFIAEHGSEGLYSTHDGFRPERLEQIRHIMQEQFPDYDCSDLLTLDGFKKLYQFLAAYNGELSLRGIANRLLIKGALSQVPKAHFGMGLPLYTTFTSPIRRYVDLNVHRNIRAILHGTKTRWLSAQDIEQLQEKLRTGRQAMNEAEQWMKLRFAETLKGKVLDGQIVQTNGAGFIVRTDDHGIEGYVNLAQGSEKFRFDSTYFQHLGSSHHYRLEQVVKVVIQQTDEASRQVLFFLVEESL
jgi:ribonuclease R